jgi:hypothetical protein
MQMSFALALNRSQPAFAVLYSASMFSLAALYSAFDMLLATTVALNARLIAAAIAVMVNFSLSFLHVLHWRRGFAGRDVVRSHAALLAVIQLFLTALPLGDLLLRCFLGDPVRFLDLADEVIALARDHVELIIG